MPTVRQLQQFLEKRRALIVPVMYGPESDREATFPQLVAEVVALAKTERGRAITECDPGSILEAVRLAASWPLKIGAFDGAALIATTEIVPPATKPRLIAYQTARGKFGILHRFGALRLYNARCVYSGEAFKAEQGEFPRIVEHEDLSLQPHKRGALIGAYVSGVQKHGDPRVLELMHRADIDQIRVNWSQDFAHGDLEEMEHFAQYAIAKCAQRFATKLLLSDEQRALVDDRLGGLPLPRIERPVGPPNRAIIEGEQPATREVFPYNPRERRSLARL